MFIQLKIKMTDFVSGYKGATGAKGPKGAIGEPGLEGFKGQKGEKGTGDQGMCTLLLFCDSRMEKCENFSNCLELTAHFPPFF